MQGVGQVAQADRERDEDQPGELPHPEQAELGEPQRDEEAGCGEADVAGGEADHERDPEAQLGDRLQLGEDLAVVGEEPHHAV